MTIFRFLYIKIEPESNRIIGLFLLLEYSLHIPYFGKSTNNNLNGWLNEIYLILVRSRHKLYVLYIIYLVLIKTYLNCIKCKFWFIRNRFRLLTYRLPLVYIICINEEDKIGLTQKKRSKVYSNSLYSKKRW